jgi:N-acetylglucosamine-6-phosphate deacetylase
MIVLSGAELVLPDRILSPGTLVLDADRIVEIRPGGAPGGGAPAFAFHGHFIAPGFIDVHVHGISGLDLFAPGDSVAAMAARLPRFGVTAFCPTTLACGPAALRLVLEQVRRARETPAGRGARVLPAHLESNFINPDFRGAQPLGCLRSPRPGLLAAPAPLQERGAGGERDSFDAADILHEIERSAPDIGIVTLAPEIDGGLDLVAWLAARGLRVSLGHSGATFDEAMAAVAAGARHATHLFNRMPPLHHRAPGLAGAVLQADDIAAEVICDGIHVHPALVRTTVTAKRPSRVMAVTDGTAAAGLPAGERATFGGRSIVSSGGVAALDDGAIAGSTVTMDRVFAMLVNTVGLSPVDAAAMCATTPARELGLAGHGIIAAGAIADLVVLDSHLTVVQTYVGGRLVYARGQGG